MTNAGGQKTLETIEVLVAFGEDERRAAVPYGLNDLLADRSIPSLVVYQELIKRLELDPLYPSLWCCRSETWLGEQ